MQKKNRNALLTLAWSGVLLASLVQAAHAQAIFIRDDDDDILNKHLFNIQGGITGEGNPDMGIFTPSRNTNAFLSMGNDATPTYNTNNVLKEILYDIGGCWTSIPGCVNGAFGNVTGDKGTGTSTPFFNTNTLVQNAFMGSSGTDKNISRYATGPAPDSSTTVTALVANAVNGPFGALLASPKQVNKYDATSTEKVGVMMKDMLKTVDDALKSATARSVPEPNTDAIGKAWKNRCVNGFNPTDDTYTTVTNTDSKGNTSSYKVYTDPEGHVTTAIGTCSSALSAQNARKDRSLESLIGPLQYLAPPASQMPAPAGGQGLYVRFQSSLSSVGTQYSPIYAAAGFCQNITQNATPIVATSQTIDTNMEDLNQTMLHETADSRLVANCWHFFEERVQYASGGRHDEQKARCDDDYKIRHIIDKNTNDACQANGRSTLQARADMAYRLDSVEYINYLNSLGVAVREQLMAQALDASERFEQDLLIERQIMNGAMAAARSKSMTYPAPTGIKDTTVNIINN